MYTILICDDNASSLEVLHLTIDKEPQFKVVAQAYDGKAAIALIEKCRPDIIILDIVMPEYDGVYIVDYVRKSMEGYSPIIYILSALGTDSIVRALNELGIDFYSMKPVSMSVIVRNLNALIKRHGETETNSAPAEDREKITETVNRELFEDTIKYILLHLGIMPHRISSKCVLDALMIYTRDPETNSLLTKVLYPQIAEKQGLNNSSVEKNIRDAISLIQRNKTDMYNDIFSYSTKGNITNGEFLSVMSDYVSKSVKSGINSA